MAYLKTAAILTRIREVLEESAGDLRTVPVGRFSGGLPEGLSETAEEIRALEAPRIETRIASKRPSPASPPVNGNLRIYELTIEVRVIRLVEPLDQLDDESRVALQALASADGDIIAQALNYPGNLTQTAAGAPTDLASGMLVYEGDASSVVGTVDGGAQTLTTVHTLLGHAIARPATS